MIENVDLLIKDVKVFNPYFKKFIDANVAVLDGKFYYIDYKKETEFKARDLVEGNNKHMIPGLIDIHMHIESSMLTPEPFTNHIAKFGTTTIVSEPHEIANVFGVEGIKEMIKAGNDSIIDVFYGIPSSVPATSKELETTGGEIKFEDMKELMDLENVICVGEVMNYRQVIQENDLEIGKFLDYLGKTNPNYIIEGHCPSLVDLDLAKFLYLGINGDHTEHSLEEIKQRFLNGMFVELQEKMIRKDILDFIIDNKLYDHMSFVTDDVMVDDLFEYGQLNKVVKKAIDLGFPINEAIYCSSFTPAARMNLRDRGAIAPGKLADFSLVNDLPSLDISRVYKNGSLIFDENTGTISKDTNFKFPSHFYESIRLDKILEEDFILRLDKDVKSVDVRVMNVKDGSTHIRESIERLPVKNGLIQWENSPYLLAAVFERYGKNKNIGYGFITGDSIKSGSVGSTWLHDNHNLLVVGSDIKTMVKVANKIIENSGGLVVAKDQEILSSLELPIAGIMSEDPIEEVALKLKNIRKDLVSLGYNHYNPIMSIGTYGLAVSPYLKLTDKGLVDVVNSKIVDLVVREYY